MTDLSRRSFLIGTAAVSAIAITGLPSLAVSEIPTLWSDGIHDDAPALTAVLSGKTAKSPSGVVFKGPVIRGGTFAVGSTIHVRSDNAEILDSHFQALRPGFTMLHFHDTSNCSIMNCTVFGADVGVQIGT